MKITSFIIAGASMIMVLVVGWLAAPYVLADRVMPGVSLGSLNVSGVKSADMTGVLQEYENEILQQTVTVKLRGKQAIYTLADLGFTVNKEATAKAIKNQSFKTYLPVKTRVQPQFEVDSYRANEILKEDFSDKLSFSKDASLQLNSTDQLELIESISGEEIDTITLEQEVSRQLALHSEEPIELVVVRSAAEIQNDEVKTAQELATELLNEGMVFTYEDKEYTMKAFTVRRLLEFTARDDPEKEGNKILGVQFNSEGLAEYLSSTIMPDINREPVNARFEFKDDRVQQFSVPSRGQTLDIDETVSNINTALHDNMLKVMLAVDVTEPTIQSNEDIEEMGITTRLASGESDFVGSPPNRVHNIHVGASKYHGLLIEPGQEFSFNEFLGPVTGEAGFKPELVIKGNQTIPEFGGGLCQVSTTIFRAAVNSGLEISNRRNHSYAVQYYGTPGFDATIYPPYTDLRFINNTPGYILVQVKITGTKIAFELWGTDDGREVEVTDPYLYDRQPDGALKASVTQKVSRDGQVVIEDTFYSNYKSPKLFPKALSEDGAKPAE